MASAILLKRMHEVETVTFLMTGDAEQQMEQTAKASEIANKLGLPHHVLDLTQCFREYVLQPFLAWRSKGAKCVLCAIRVKFKALMTSLKLDCQGIATGRTRVLARELAKVSCLMMSGAARYQTTQRSRDVWTVILPARPVTIAVTRALEKSKDELPVFLYRAADPRRDQSYFMYRLTPDVLRHVIFPVGGLSKDEVRSIIAEEGLSVATEKDSQDLCFLDGKSLRTYLREQIGQEEHGPFIDLEGRVIGEHGGIWQFTVGQRRHLGESFGRRMTVVALDPERNAVILGDESDALMEALLLEDCYFPYEMPHKFDAAVKLRSQGISLPVHVEKKCDNEVLVHFDVPVRLSSPGQSAVFYEDDRVLGGGVVSRLILLKNRP